MDNRIKWHNQLVKIIKKYGNKKPKSNGHGNNYEVQFSNGWIFDLDDYNNSINLKDIYKIDKITEKDVLHIGTDFGGFETELNEKSYKYILGTIAKRIWNSRKNV